MAAWLHPEGMSCRVHSFDPREGGEFRISLIYKDQTGSNSGKTTETTDTFRGRFVRLVPNEQVVEEIEFETANAAGGTDLTWLHENIPEGVRPADNEAGTRMALNNLAALVEAA